VRSFAIGEGSNKRVELGPLATAAALRSSPEFPRLRLIMIKSYKPLLLALLVVPSGAPVTAQATAHVVIVATTDVHGRAYHWDYLNDREAPWGLTRAATVVDSLRREYPGQIVVVDGGDLLQGSPFATFFGTVRETDPHPVIDALNGVGYDVTTPGNHDFDFGLAVFARAISAAAFAVVSGNVYRMPRDTLAFQPFVMLQRNGVRIGITGFTTPGVMVWNRDQVSDQLAVRRILPEANRTLQQMENEGAQLKVVLAHSGMGSASSYDTTRVGAENVAAQLAGLPVKPDVVVVGHSHRDFADSVINGVHFVQPRAWGESLAVVHVWFTRDPDSDDARVSRIVSDQVSLAGVRPHSVVSQRLQRAHESVRLWVVTPLAKTEGDWSAHYARAMDTPIIDFVNEVQRSATGAQLSGTAAFDLTVNWGQDIRLRDVAALYPYENTLKVVRIDGATLKDYLEHSARYYKTYPSDGSMIETGIPGYAFDIVSGVDYVLDLTQPPGSRVRQLAWHQRLVQPADTFTLAINSYRQSGGGGYTMLASLPVIYEGGVSVSDLITAQIRVAGVLRADDYFEPSWTITPSGALEAIQRELGPPPRGADRVALGDSAETVFTVPDTGRREPPPRPLPAIARMKYPAERSDGENPLGSLIADALRNGARTQFAIVLNGAIGADLPAGSVTMRDLGAVLPRGDSLFRLEVSGQELYEVLERSLSGSTPIAHVAGMEVWYDPARDAGDRVRRVRFPDGENVRRNGAYSLAATASVVTGGVGFDMLFAVPRQSTGMTELDALAGYLRRLRQPADIPRDARLHSNR